MPDDYREIQEGVTTYVKLGTAVFIILAILFIVFILITVQRRAKMIADAKEMKVKFQTELLRSQLEIQEQTLKNISEEIHDNIGQALSLAKLNLNTLNIVTDESQLQKLSNTKELVSKAIVDLRSLSRSLDAEFILQMGLMESIDYALDMIRKTGTHATELSITGTQFRIDKQKELILFRIVQEVLNNIIKHAKANKIRVSAEYDADRFQLIIADNGQGVDLSPLNENNHSGFGLGIRNMHNRAKLIGAEFRMNSTLGKGTEVNIILKKIETDKTLLQGIGVL